MPQHDITELKRNANIVEIVGKRIALTKRGAEWKGLCPFHDDHKKSLHVNEAKQVFGCFACGKSGDVIDFLVDMGATLPEALAELSGELTNQHTPTVKKRERTKAITWKQVTPAPMPGQIVHFRHGAPSRTWEYRSPAGLLGLICRFDTPDGKEVLPYTYCTDGDRREWRWQGFDKPRPLYNLDQIANRPNDTILIVEGEKTAEAAAALLPHIVVTCWQGGARAITSTDWTPLNGRKIVLWPDNDAPGTAAMQDIADLIRPNVAAMKWVPCPPDAPDKWDVADADWTPEQALAYVRANIQAVPERQPEPEPPAPEPEPEYTPPPPDFDTSGYTPPPDDFGATEKVIDEDFFTILGFTKESDKPMYWFFVHSTKQIYGYTVNSLSLSNMLTLAPLEWWQDQFPKPKAKGGFNAEAAQNWCVQHAIKAGIFSAKKIRGRGAWMDSGRVIIHTGDHMVVDGRSVALGSIKTKYVYQQAEPLNFPTENPLTTIEANRLMEVMNLLNWERPINAHLLAGWCVIAPICGALKWRPHIWLTGASGTGKSWVFKNLVRTLLGENAMSVQSQTTEAGIRQELAGDAIPIVFDEAEGEDRRAKERMEQVIELMRASSAEDGGNLTKGTAGGSARQFRIRSCFAFASIGVQITQASDRSRVTILAIQRPAEETRAERWEQLQAKYAEIVTAQFVARLQARTISLIPTILDNAQIFAAAVAVELGEQRAGDQIGTLLAGAYSLYSNGKISFDQAREWVKDKDWSEERQHEDQRDEMALFNRIMEHMVKVDGINATPVERTVGELCVRATGEKLDSLITSSVAYDKLLRFGFKVEDNHVTISNSHTEVLKILRDTPWSKNHGKTLARIEGAVQIASARFGPGSPTRAVKIPMRYLR